MTLLSFRGLDKVWAGEGCGLLVPAFSCLELQIWSRPRHELLQLPKSTWLLGLPNLSFHLSNLLKSVHQGFVGIKWQLMGKLWASHSCLDIIFKTACVLFSELCAVMSLGLPSVLYPALCPLSCSLSPLPCLISCLLCPVLSFVPYPAPCSRSDAPCPCPALCPLSCSLSPTIHVPSLLHSFLLIFLFSSLPNSDSSFFFFFLNSAPPTSISEDC